MSTAPRFADRAGHLPPIAGKKVLEKIDRGKGNIAHFLSLTITRDRGGLRLFPLSKMIFFWWCFAMWSVILFGQGWWQPMGSFNSAGGIS